jgi:multiple sugar transport system substrate-binding protein
MGSRQKISSNAGLDSGAAKGPRLAIMDENRPCGEERSEGRRPGLTALRGRASVFLHKERREAAGVAFAARGRRKRAGGRFAGRPRQQTKEGAMNHRAISRRRFIEGGLTLTALGSVPLARSALAASEEETIIAAAKSIGKTDLRALIWSNYFVPMEAPMTAFQKATGIGITHTKDIAEPSIPQAAMAEALTHSPEFDLIHLDSAMIPSLASAGYLEPLDPYMEKAHFQPHAVGHYGQLATYGGKTYGIITDGNIFVEMLRKDLMEDPDNKKRFEDKFGTPLVPAKNWDEEFRLMKFFHNPEKKIWGSGNLRGRGWGYIWYLMYLYGFGGFPFDADMKPTFDTEAGQKALAVYLRDKEVAFADSPSWGTTEMIPRIVSGNVVACQYWDGVIKLAENPKKSKTVGKWLYGVVPGGESNGKPLYRAAGMPVVVLTVNRYSPRKAAAAYLACWLGTEPSSVAMVTNRVATFHDAWTVGEMSDPRVATAYTPAGLEAVKQNLEISSPSIYVTGNLEFTDALDKTLGETYVGQVKAADALKRIDEDFAKIIKRIGVARLKKDYETYHSIMPKISKPTA